MWTRTQTKSQETFCQWLVGDRLLSIILAHWRFITYFQDFRQFVTIWYLLWFDFGHFCFCFGIFFGSILDTFVSVLDTFVCVGRFCLFWWTVVEWNEFCDPPLLKNGYFPLKPKYWKTILGNDVSLSHAIIHFSWDGIILHVHSMTKYLF